MIETLTNGNYSEVFATKQNQMRTERILITPEKAKLYLSKMEINRPLMNRVVEYYAIEMNNGQWNENTHQGIAFDCMGRLVDGQHRMRAIILSNKSLYMNVTWGVSNDAFKTMDSGSNRTIGQVMSIDGIKNYNSHSAGITAYLSLLKSKTTPGAHFNRMQTKVTSIDAVNFYWENKELCDLLHMKCTQYYTKRRFATLSFLYSFSLIMIHKNNKPFGDVFDFLDQLFEIAPTKSYVCELMKNRLYANKISKAKLPSSYISALLIKTWNAYKYSKNLRVLKYTDEEPFPTIL